MAADHTPGTWFVDADEPEHTVSSDHGQIICRALVADDFPCLEEGTEDHMNAEALANARLIAAAPKMIAALHDAYECDLPERVRESVAEAITSALGNPVSSTTPTFEP